ncbi:SRPBCC family protein [Streptantibioticus cattleyicolor]|uniref:Activator of Hsp90 ATPase 1 family protein n=1 Tax=Streptantibioticus cattleyicolor (strain ATCC 35852 / DSM 46488 / JCM 4925 / NBRC 14057 / NRRL 8057) TaxID=1003195 RepID=F8JLA4_STREN|nr:SRPBCC family protein [Streptantibioticus cattleyicolor]AEW99610.1 Activator of Hsp90 ATPase 1 family protein [Streptantibioticus cattleyicolor NRRL 8057 = DSM 46488]CCB71353.1 Activator of Hsp90 ATPase-like protein [Streptantibioticus cattleyicolor NRRL 8057 = DSM 46488]
MSTAYHVTARSAADPHTVFAILLRGATWPSWSPIDAFSLDGPGPADGPQHVGDVREFRTGRNVSRERVDKLEPPSRFEYSIVGSGPLKDYRAVVELRPAASGQGTEIHWSATFRPQLAGTGWFWRSYLSRYMQRMVEGLAAYAAEHAGEFSA